MKYVLNFSKAGKGTDFLKKSFADNQKKFASEENLKKRGSSYWREKNYFI